MRIIERSSIFKKDYKRAAKGIHQKTLDIKFLRQNSSKILSKQKFDQII